MAVKNFSIRIEKDMLEKIGYVSDYHGRSINSHILVLIRSDIKDFEAEHGVIEGEIEPSLNVKPGSRN